MHMRYDRLNPNIKNSKGTGKARYAPHKPLLLLCIIDLAEAGEIDPPLLFKTPGLRLRFDSYYAISQPRWRNRITLDLPFHHLSTQGFWQALTKEGTRKSRFCSEKTRQGMIRNISFQSSEQT